MKRFLRHHGDFLVELAILFAFLLVIIYDQHTHPGFRSLLQIAVQVVIILTAVRIIKHQFITRWQGEQWKFPYKVLFLLISSYLAVLGLAGYVLFLHGTRW